jgi:hypothetical protein
VCVRVCVRARMRAVYNISYNIYIHVAKGLIHKQRLHSRILQWNTPLLIALPLFMCFMECYGMYMHTVELG